jgi:hypothetical protein
MGLSDYLKDSDLQRKLDNVKDYTKQNLLRFWQIRAPHFVDHGETHSSSIESLLARIIPTTVLERMGEHEIFLLLCGVWLHDIGMISKEQGETDNEVREKHNVKSRELIRNSLPEIQLTDDERYVVGEIAFYHRKSEDINNAVETYETQFGSTVSKIRVRFLCGLLRLADGCEIAHSRSSRKLLQINDLDEEAKFHHEIHLHVSAVDFDNISQEILISARVKNDADKLLLENFLKADLEKELVTVKAVLSKYGVEYETVKPIITIDSFANAMPKPLTESTSLSLEEKLLAIEKRTGYYPVMVMDNEKTIHIYYETIAQTAKELQSEVISVIRAVCELFFDKERIILTLNKIHDYTGTIGPVEPEIVTVVFDIKDLNNARSKAELWAKLRFFRRMMNDRYLNNKARLDWRLVP